MGGAGFGGSEPPWGNHVTHWDPARPTPDTTQSMPIIIHDVNHEKARNSYIQEAEQLMGYPPNCTAGGGVSIHNRLEGLGDGWDRNNPEMIRE